MRLDLSHSNELKKRRALPWIALCGVLAVYVLAAFRFDPALLFGMTHDDTLYFASAKALASHQGYVLPSVPIQPMVTKYPVLYPWLLSWVWRWNPSFPSNLRDAVALTVVFGCVFVVASFFFLRELKGIGQSAALLITFFVATHSVLQFYSASVLSDVPFAALALVAMLVADRAIRPDSGGASAALCAVLTGTSILMRLFGVPIAAGIVAAGATRRAWRQTVIFCATLVPFGIPAAWHLVRRPNVIPLSRNGWPGGLGFVHTWIYYTSYEAFWKLSVLQGHVLWGMLKGNAVLALLSPAAFFLAPLFARDNVAGTSVMLLVTLAICAGIVRQAQGDKWRPIHFAFPFYVGLTLIWNYSNTGRFLFLFLPLFAAGLWVEVKHFLGVFHAGVGADRAPSQRVLAGALLACLVGLLCGLGANYVAGATTVIRRTVDDRGRFLSDKREAYQWLSCCTAPDDVVISYEDASAYLYSGRHGMRPIAFPTSGEYNPAYVQQSLAHITDVAQALGARYWMVAGDDFSMDWEPATSLGRARVAELEKNLRLVFRSRNGYVRVYEIRCDAASNAGLCP
jgi:hypothetical protein